MPWSKPMVKLVIDGAKEVAYYLMSSDGRKPALTTNVKSCGPAEQGYHILHEYSDEGISGDAANRRRFCGEIRLTPLFHILERELAPHLVSRIRFAIDFDVRINKEVQRLAILLRY